MDMTLFGEQAEYDYQRAVTLVEEVVRALGIDPAHARAQAQGSGDAFSLRRGSASMLVTLQHGKRADDEGTIRIIAPLVTLPTEPAKEHAMMRKLLQSNARELSSAAFALVDGHVVVVSERSVQDLDASEVDRMIRSVGRVADRYDDALAAEFGVQRVADRTT